MTVVNFEFEIVPELLKAVWFNTKRSTRFGKFETGVKKGVKYRFGKLAMLLGSAARANSGFKSMRLYRSCYPLFISIRFASTNTMSDRFELFFGECFIDSFYPAHW